ncbi:unnamed protein product [Amoebophrya sp. A120]|nr:unnamed protein product [Amoebophrya sp. A120]|eukprot:GSA120T00011331001.1
MSLARACRFSTAVPRTPSTFAPALVSASAWRSIPGPGHQQEQAPLLVPSSSSYYRKKAPQEISRTSSTSCRSSMDPCVPSSSSIAMIATGRDYTFTSGGPTSRISPTSTPYPVPDVPHYPQHGSLEFLMPFLPPAAITRVGPAVSGEGYQLSPQEVVPRPEAMIGDQRPALEQLQQLPSCKDKYLDLPPHNEEEIADIECAQHYYRKWTAQRAALIGLTKLRKIDCGPKKIHWAWWRDKQIAKKKKKKCI